MHLQFSVPWNRIRSWKSFYRWAAQHDRPLLAKLRQIPNSVLVAGCQRSGTTALTRAIANSDGFAKFRITRDDELDAALILSGYEKYHSTGRHCFQTTYLNDRFKEYLDPANNFRLVWVIRNPHSVVHSMTYHWRRAALERLFESCGRAAAESYYRRSGTDFDPRTLPRIEKACFAYVGKSAQLADIAKVLSPQRLVVIDYDRLCVSPEAVLSAIFEFIGEPFHPHYAQGITTTSLMKSNRLSAEESALVDMLCTSTFTMASCHLSRIAAA